ncbi:MAG TPA: hypothetical protein VL463_09565 [Kofleriaceae bacterium]|nr:hypothetical protein [Kofleriaceae bacterium]
MRALAGFAVIAGVLALATTVASAKPKKKPADDDSEAVSADVKKGLIVLSDGEGTVIAVDKTWTDDHWVFYGDGKTMYRQRVFGGGADGGAGTWDYSFWSPRVPQASIAKTQAGKFIVYCGNDETELKQLSDADAKKMLDAAVWKKSLWHRQAQFLARDDHGTYYYVDRMRDEYGGKGHRIFVGPKGGMKEMPMTNVVSDSKGEIYATKRGELRFITATDAASWVNGGTKTDLTIVPVEDNVPMIYRDLGVYEGTLGTPCDDQ